jgi:hypothetical protein
MKKTVAIMTKTVSVRVDLKHLSAEVASLVPDFDRDDTSAIYWRPGRILKTLWTIKKGRKFATAVSAWVTLPRALSMSDFAIGTSVFAAGRVGLEIVRIALACAGLPKSALDEISIDHVTITGATVTYMLPCAGRNSPARLKKLIHQHALLIGLRVNSWIGQFQYRITQEAEASAANTREICELVGTEVSADPRLLDDYVLLDVVLDEHYVKRLGWESLASWRNAYEEKRYKRIFDRVVRGMFQLDGPKREHPEPSQHIIDQLGLRNQQIFREYLQGKDSATFDSFSFVRSDMDSSRTKSWRDAQKTILAQTGINIKKMWKEYRWYYPDALAAQLVYPGDHSPDTEDILTRFCSENWSALLANLRLEYAAASR